MDEKEPEEEEGIKMIIFLQSTVGITETREQAIKGWRTMRPHERMQTLRVYNMFH
jgi:hypothetical protein